MLRRILVPIDGTECSWRALEYACELVRFSGGSLVVMTVDKGQYAEPILAAEGDPFFAHIGNEVLDSANAMLAGKNIDCTYLLENGGNVAASILETVQSEGCDGIVLGSRGMGVIEGLFRSSVSQLVLENAEVPVTIVK
ncbi:MAG: universal stress protein [Phascolarctobacterium sp.]